MSKEAPLKSLTIFGNLQNRVSYKLCPINEFSEGVWNICVNSLFVKCKTPDYNEVCEVSCNLSKAQKFNEFGQVEWYQQPFGIFIISNGNNDIMKLGKS